MASGTPWCCMLCRCRPVCQGPQFYLHQKVPLISFAMLTIRRDKVLITLGNGRMDKLEAEKYENKRWKKMILAATVIALLVIGGLAFGIITFAMKFEEKKLNQWVQIYLFSLLFELIVFPVIAVIFQYILFQTLTSDVVESASIRSLLFKFVNRTVLSLSLIHI
eukprot:TRINITY_DN1658_c0_g1_i4.p2 TRINITY_DN1658_c0_g1~~TRINITY_DN1658_c0_g1_i4.p2  ORF type:complete len:164 (+),score=25.45 TRINITY_DN1658_c0_g1_i4:931-1422(+)